jgi:hypothetical protein
MEIFTRLGRLVRIKNSFSTLISHEVSSYISVWVKSKKGPECLLFTDAEIERARMRSERNKKDLTKRSLISQILD